MNDIYFNKKLGFVGTLFKGKSEHTGRWIFSCAVIDNRPIGGAVFLRVIEDGPVGNWIQIDGSTLCAFSGLYDSNGTPIFDGDVLVMADDKDHEAPLCVNFNHATWNLETENGEYLMREINGTKINFALGDTVSDCYTVIGNRNDGGSISAYINAARLRRQ